MRGLLVRQFLVSMAMLLGATAGAFAAASAQPSAGYTLGEGDDASSSVLGNYLAGRFAKTAQDTQSAAEFYSRALTRDPDNEVLLEQAFQMETMSGSFDRAVPLAEQLVASHQSHRMAHFLLGVTAYKAGDYTSAEDHFKSAAENPIGELTSAIALGWTRLAAGNTDGALSALELPKQPDWAQFYLRYHRALIADIAGRKDMARASYEKMFRQDSRTLRTSLAYAQHAAHEGDYKLARSILKEQASKTQGDVHPLVKELLDRVEKAAGQAAADSKGVDRRWANSLVDLMKALDLDSSFAARTKLAQELGYTGGSGGLNTWLQEKLIAKYVRNGKLVKDAQETADTSSTVPLLVDKPIDGLAEVFYGLGEALTGEGGVSLGTTYLRLALDAKPDHAFALAALANAQETAHRYDDALATYDKIPNGTPLQSAVEIRKAFDLSSLDRQDDAKKILESLVKTDAEDVRPLEALGNIMRSRKEYGEAVNYFTKAIAVLSSSDPRLWGYYYARGTAYERLKNWPAAEADLKKALALAPDQPLVLNYLGYSWVDQGLHLKEGMNLIEKAVQLKPDDGYIVDSLGWAHFRQGNFKDAVRFLERAVEIKPEDPTLNDHLGDAFWRVGREREARFQWNQALSLDPEPEDAQKIKAKIDRGLDLGSSEVKKKKGSEEVQTSEPLKRRTENKTGAPRPAVE